ncbi:MAG: hypothetical protein HC773_29265 [Scytonema sp. CRU_2_7]|nr:hypothetical protein [Scytonema sp. CRU_2_7]
MKTKIFGLALMLSLAATLGACEGDRESGGPGGATTSPAPTGEPTDTGASGTKSPSPAATGAASPKATAPGAGSPKATATPTPTKTP